MLIVKGLPCERVGSKVCEEDEEALKDGLEQVEPLQQAPESHGRREAAATQPSLSRRSRAAPRQAISSRCLFGQASPPRREGSASCRTTNEPLQQRGQEDVETARGQEEGENARMGSRGSYRNDEPVGLQGMR